MPEIQRGPNFLTSKEEICTYLGGIGDKLWNKFIALKMPVTCIDGKWYGHAENIDAWWRLLTSKKRPGIE